MLLIAQVLRRLLVGDFSLTQLLRQTRRVLLQCKQGALALFVLGDALVQLLALATEPGVAFVGVLVQQLCRQRMRIKAWGQGLLLGSELFLLLQQLFCCAITPPTSPRRSISFSLSWSTTCCALACSLSSWRPRLCSSASG